MLQQRGKSQHYIMTATAASQSPQDLARHCIRLAIPRRDKRSFQGMSPLCLPQTNPCAMPSYCYERQTMTSSMPKGHPGAQLLLLWFLFFLFFYHCFLRFVVLADSVSARRLQDEWNELERERKPIPLIGCWCCFWDS